MGEVASIYTTVAGLIDCAIKTGAAAEGLGAIPVEGKIQYLGIFFFFYPGVETQESKI